MKPNFVRAPHRPEPERQHAAANAALLIDFDNVTMGIRSNLAQELRNLLESEIIKGKVAVQRAYADWRRYPQYVVSLSESSIDLIFAPAYGSTKKNATDIRLAIDAVELVFTRPEIGTYIILSGDSDFSGMVMKLKEYGKYVIGVGIYESSSDLLIQNCDEYYSYTALTGLQRAGLETVERHDPWELVDKAIRRMAERGDTMRSDRLKQVMLEIDPGFAEKDHGFSRFNKFVGEAAGRGLLTSRKLENGQCEVAPGPEAGRAAEEAAAAIAVASALEAESAAAEGEAEEEQRRRGSRGARGRGRREDGRRQRARRAGEGGRGRGGSRGGGGRGSREGPSLSAAFALLEEAVRDLSGGQERAVRDRDLKRKMLELNPRFDEGALGYARFGRFLQEAHNAEVVELRKAGNAGYLVALKRPGTETVPIFGEGEDEGASRSREGRGGRGRGRPRSRAGGQRRTSAAAVSEEEGAESEAGEPAELAASPEASAESEESKSSLTRRALGLLRGRRGSRGRPQTPETPPPILEGQTDPRAQEPEGGADGEGSG